MAGSISNFKASFRGDLARPNRFDVNIPVPLTLLPYVKSAKSMQYRCEVAQLPGRSLSTTEQKFGSNPVEKHPYQTTYNDIDLTFIVSGDMREKMFFDAWMEVINPSSNFNFRYKKDYSTSIVIRQYDVTNKLVYDAMLIDAFPSVVNQLDLEWSSDGYHKLSVVFEYTYWTNTMLTNMGKNVLTQGLTGLNSFLNTQNF